MKKYKIIAAVFVCMAAFAVTVCAILIFTGKSVVNTSYVYKSEKVPPQFDGFKIALITDFHNSENYAQVAQKVQNTEPDIILIVGDLISMETTDYSNTQNLIKKLMNIAQVYYTFGNHEYYNQTFNAEEEPPIKNVLKGSGVIFMNNSIRTLKKDGALINLIGYGDSIHADNDGAFWQHARPFMEEISQSIDKNVLAVLMLHRAQYFDETSKYPFDITLGGHLHGGEVAIAPIRSALLRKRVGTDKYSKGEYSENGHKLYISAGCSSEGEVRLFNPPEVVSIVLKRVKQ